MGLVTVLRPNEAGGAVLADDTDATYVAPNGAFLEYRFGTLAIPAGDRVEWVRLRSRHSNPLNNGVLLSHHIGHENVDYPRYFTNSWVTPSSVVTEFIDVQHPTNREGAAWSQADVDALMAQLLVGKPAPYDQDWSQTRAHELYIDVSVNRKPVVSAITPTNGSNVTTARPTYGFTFSDLDGDTQRSFEIKVFRLAETPAPNPDTTTPWWHSGEILGAGNSKQQTKDFTVNGAYRIAIRASQNWTLPGGTYWGNWTTVDVNVVMTQPAAPQIKANPESDRARNAVTVLAVDAAAELITVEYSDDLETWLPLRRGDDAPRPGNLLTANQATLATDASGWTAASNTTIARSTTQAKEGAASLRLTANAAGAIGAFVSNVVPCLPGDWITVFASARAATTARDWTIRPFFYSEPDADVAVDLPMTYQPRGDQGADASGSWDDGVYSVQAPEGARSVTFAVSIGVTGTAPANGEQHYIDRHGLFVGDSPEVAWTTPGAVTTRRFYDYEAAPFEYRHYRAFVTDLAGGGRASSPVSASARAKWVTRDNHLKDPLHSDRNITVRTSEFNYAPQKPGTVNDVLGRATSVIVHEGWKGMKGHLAFWLLDKAAHDAVLAILMESDVFLYQNVLGQQWYLQLVEQLEFDPQRAMPLSTEDTPIRHLHALSIAVIEAARP